MASIRLRYDSGLRVVKTFEGPFVDPDDPTITVNKLGEASTHDGESDVPVEKHAAFQQALTDGAATIDLTALPGDSPEETVDGSGLKVQFVKFRAHADNANAITIVPGVSNAYDLAGDFSLTLLAGQSALLKLDEAAPEIDGTNKTLDISGTGTQVLEVHLILG